MKQLIRSIILLLPLYLLLTSSAPANQLEEKFLKAAENGDIAAVRSLLAQGVDVNAKNVQGRTALMDAVQNNHVEIVKLLLDKGAEIEAKDKSGVTALSLAILAGYPDITHLLIEKTAKEGEEAYIDLANIYKEEGGVKDPHDLTEMWKKFRTYLAEGKVDLALQFISPTTRETYQHDMNELAQKAPKVLQQSAADMADMEIYEIENDYALGRFKFSYKGKNVSSEVHFIKDFDGLWRIEEF